MLHSKLINGSIHVAHAFTYANAAARTGAVGLVATDIGKIALQSDSSTFWILQNNSPVTWVSITGGNPSGVILPYGGIAAPEGYLLCDGTSYLRTDYPALFAAIGTAFGAADGTHFNVPKAQGQFLRGRDNGAGVDPNAASRTALMPGGATGDNVGSSQTDEFKSHVHANSAFENLGGSNTNFMYNGANNNINVDTAAAGGNETRPKNIYTNFIIKI